MIEPREENPATEPRVEHPATEPRVEHPATEPRVEHPATDLWVERTGTRRYTGHSSRGAEVLIGSVTDEGVFTPGELLKIALAGCVGLSSDQPLRRRLGDDFPAAIRVSGDADRDQERYPQLSEKLEVDLSGLSAEDRQRLLLVVTRAVDQVCTVGRTLKSGTEITFDIVETGTGDRGRG